MSAKTHSSKKHYIPRRSQRLRDEKKKVFTTYRSHISTVLDNLPYQVIQYEIFPFLDYNSRINLNMCLPVWDRVRTRMPSQSLKKHQTDCCVKIVGSILKSLEYRNPDTNKWSYTGDRRLQRMIHMLELFKTDQYFFLYTHFPGFREAFSTKLDEMIVLSEQHRAGHQLQEDYSSTWIDQLVSTCNSLRNKILTSNSELSDNYSYKSIPVLSFT
jgi:hypothetical protein